MLFGEEPEFEVLLFSLGLVIVLVTRPGETQDALASCRSLKSVAVLIY